MHGSVFLFLACALLSAVAAAPAPPPSHGPRCSPVSFQVSATAQNEVYQNPPDPNNETSILTFLRNGVEGHGNVVLGTTPVGGTWTITGMYCTPRYGKPGKDALQVLVHGAGYNKAIWAGFGLGQDMYNWHAYATSRGYSTLALDRLGHGDDRPLGPLPEPLHVVQANLHVEVVHQLITAIRTTDATPLGRAFGRVVYVGHSYGSFVGFSVARQYPGDVDAHVLTGATVDPNVTGWEDNDIRSAANVAPARFPPSTTPLGYLATGSAAQREASYYAGDYDAAVARADFAAQDTWTIGEASSSFPQTPAAAFQGALFLATGAQDRIFCRTGRVAACEETLRKTRRLWFPRVEDKSFGLYAPDRTGHDLTVHRSAPVTFEKVHDFLDGVLGGGAATGEL